MRVNLTAPCQAEDEVSRSSPRLLMPKLYLADDDVKISFQLLRHRGRPVVLGCVPAWMPPAVCRRAAVLLGQMSMSK